LFKVKNQHLFDEAKGIAPIFCRISSAYFPSLNVEMENYFSEVDHFS
jgi:hypothetical protein